jgi:hypothetical protein
MKSYDGALNLWKDWIILNNAKGKPIIGRHLAYQERIAPGSEVKFMSNVALVGECVISPKDLSMCSGSGISAIGIYVNNSQQEVFEDDCSLAVHASISLGLDFSPVINFAKEMRRKFATLVHPSHFTGHFTMVVSFDRACFRLNDDSVSIALEAAIGGYCVDLKVSLLRDRVFYFNVSCKQIGFQVYNLKKFECKQFKCFFHLWGFGGPNWQNEFSEWQRECREEWTLVSPTKKRAHLGLQALKLGAPKSILRKSNHISNRRLIFSDSISYAAWKGYQDPNIPSSSGSSNLEMPVMFKIAALPEISFGSFKPFDFVQKCAETSTQSGSRSVFAVGADFAVSNADSVSPEKESGPSAADGLQSVVDDIAYQFWACGKCLSMGHDTTACTNQIRCKGYFHYGHIKKNCFGKKEKKRKGLGS